MGQGEAVTLDQAVTKLLAEHEVAGNRYQTFKNAETHAWNNWAAFGKDTTERGQAWRAVAEEIGERYHNVKWLQSAK